MLIHRVSTAGIGVLCQLECEGPFRGEVLAWMPGYGPAADDGPAAGAADGPAPAPGLAGSGESREAAPPPGLR